MIDDKVLDYLEGEGKSEVLQEIANDDDKEFRTMELQFGETPWLLITAVRNMVTDTTSLTHAMSLGAGVLLKVTEKRGAGGVAISTVYVPNAVIEKDLDDIELYKVVTL